MNSDLYLLAACFTDDYNKIQISFFYKENEYIFNKYLEDEDFKSALMIINQQSYVDCRTILLASMFRIYNTVFIDIPPLVKQNSNRIERFQSLFDLNEFFIYLKLHYIQNSLIWENHFLYKLEHLDSEAEFLQILCTNYIGYLIQREIEMEKNIEMEKTIVHDISDYIDISEISPKVGDSQIPHIVSTINSLINWLLNQKVSINNFVEQATILIEEMPIDIAMGWYDKGSMEIIYNKTTKVIFYYRKYLIKYKIDKILQ